MKNFFTIIFIQVVCCLYMNAQNKKSTVYLMFDKQSVENCVIENGSGDFLRIKKYRKDMNNNHTVFYICEESFVLDNKQNSDTCDIEILDKIRFMNIQSILKRKDSLKEINFFKNTVFENIYIIERYNNWIIKNPVIWNTDLTEY